jgi:hypothetical protein
MTPVCQRQGHVYDSGSAMYRCTVEAKQPIDRLTVIHGLTFISQQVNVDLCPNCFDFVYQQNNVVVTHHQELLGY